MYAHWHLSVGMILTLQDMTAESRLSSQQRGPICSICSGCALQWYAGMASWGSDLQVVSVANLHLFLPLRQLRPPEQVRQVLAVQLQGMRGHPIHRDAITRGAALAEGREAVLC